MHFLEAGAIIKVARDKIWEKQIWEKWLVEYQLSPYTETPVKNFEDYKKQILTLSKLSSMTKEEKERDFEATREKAREAIRRLNPKKDLGRKKLT